VPILLTGRSAEGAKSNVIEVVDGSATRLLVGYSVQASFGSWPDCRRK